jgi:hypothetical protein
VIGPPDPPRMSRRRAIALLGAAAAGTVATGSIIAADMRSIDEPAKATAQAVRRDPPLPPGGFDPASLYVALYGHPGSRILGSLGEQDLPAAVNRAKMVAGQYVDFGRPVVPSFEIITTVASSEAGSDGNYSNEFPPSLFQPWIDTAAAEGMYVILDLQPGRSTFPFQARQIEGLLLHPHVGLALDPEWRVGPNQRPGGGFIGTVDGTEVNETIDYLDELIRRHRLPPKVLVVHQFTPAMVTSKSIIRGTPNVLVLFQMDGFGSMELKVASWNRMVADLPPDALTGWKNFYDEDRPTPTPAQSLSVSPRPVYISYQ